MWNGNAAGPLPLSPSRQDAEAGCAATVSIGDSEVASAVAATTVPRRRRSLCALSAMFGTSATTRPHFSRTALSGASRPMELVAGAGLANLLHPLQRLAQIPQPVVLPLGDEPDAPGQRVTPAPRDPGLDQRVEDAALLHAQA